MSNLSGGVGSVPYKRELSQLGMAPGASGAVNALRLQEQLALGGFMSLTLPGTYRLTAACSLVSDTTLELGPGVTLDASSMSTPCITATSKSNIRLCGDGKIVCAAASVPTFTSCSNIECLVRIEDGSGNKLIPTLSSSWQRVPSLFRLRLTGTGTCVMDARDSLGNVTSSVASFTASGATDQIEFPFAGDDAVNVRFTLTGTCLAEVL